jgi:tetratricopeptide (TPR) repeat protein
MRTLAPAFAAVARAGRRRARGGAARARAAHLRGRRLLRARRAGHRERLFDAALRLDADSPHATRNLREIARRRKTGLTVVDLPKSTAVAVRQLVPRAARVAAAAVPATDKRISLCMIVKDEEGMLGRCLGAVVDHVDEVIVVDTGSTDRTVEIAEAFGARVLHHAWTGDFAAARNVSLDAATGDWVLYLDADEVLVDGDGPRLRALAGHTWREAIYLVETNHTGELEDGTAVMHNALRLFRRRPEYRFEGRLHEQFAHRLPGFLPERIEASDVRIDHFGYLGAVRDAKEKSRRNIELVRRQIAESEPTAVPALQPRLELAAAGEPHAALVEFRAAWDKLDLSDGARSQNFVPSLAGRLVRTLGWVGELEEARERAAQALELFPEYTDLVLEQASIARRTGDDAEAERLLRRCLEMGDAPEPALADGRRRAPTSPSSRSPTCLRATGRLDQADELVQACLAEHPRFLGSIEPYATIRLKAGAAPADVVAAVDATVGELSPGARFMLAVALHEAGAFAEAEEQLRAVVAARSDSAPARMAHAEVLLCLGRFAEAAAAGRRARRHAGRRPARILALLADGRTDEAAQALGAAPDLPAEAAPAVVGHARHARRGRGVRGLRGPGDPAGLLRRALARAA